MSTEPPDDSPPDSGQPSGGGARSSGPGSRSPSDRLDTTDRAGAETGQRSPVPAARVTEVFDTSLSMQAVRERPKTIQAAGAPLPTPEHLRPSSWSPRLPVEAQLDRAAPAAPTPTGRWSEGPAAAAAPDGRGARADDVPSPRDDVPTSPDDTESAQDLYARLGFKTGPSSGAPTPGCQEAAESPAPSHLEGEAEELGAGEQTVDRPDKTVALRVRPPVPRPSTPPPSALGAVGPAPQGTEQLRGEPSDLPRPGARHRATSEPRAGDAARTPPGPASPEPLGTSESRGDGPPPARRLGPDKPFRMPERPTGPTFQSAARWPRPATRLAAAAVTVCAVAAALPVQTPGAAGGDVQAPWHVLTAPGTPTFVAAATAVLGLLVFRAPFGPRGQATAWTLLGASLLGFALALMRSGVMRDVFDGQPALGALFEGHAAGRVSVAVVMTGLGASLVWAREAPTSSGARVLGACAAGLGVAMYLGLHVFSGSPVAPVVGLADAAMDSPFRGDRLAAWAATAPLLGCVLALTAAVRSGSHRLVRAAWALASGGVALACVVLALHVAKAEAWPRVLEPLKLALLLSAALWMLPAGLGRLFLLAGGSASRGGSRSR